jgi:5-(carboxyamino)imidazole ribonucleotide mutase
MSSPEIAIVMGSTSDWATMKHAADLLEQFGVHALTRVVSAHRTPQRLYEFAASAEAEGLKIIIAWHVGGPDPCPCFGCARDVQKPFGAG